MFIIRLRRTSRQLVDALREIRDALRRDRQEWPTFDHIGEAVSEPESVSLTVGPLVNTTEVA